MQAAAKKLIGQPLSSLLGGVSAAAPPVSGYVAHWSALVSSSITVTGAGVSQWSDLSGNGNHLVQATDADRPPYSRTMNGVTVPEFDGTSDNLACTSLTASDDTTTRFVVAEVDTLAVHHTLFGSTAGSGLHFAVSQTNGRLASNREGVVLLGEMILATVAASTPFVAVERCTPVSVMHWKELTFEQDQISAAGLIAGRTFVMGKPYFATQLLDGLLAEAIVYDTALTPVQVAEVIAWLQARWGVA